MEAIGPKKGRWKKMVHRRSWGRRAWPAAQQAVD